MSSSKDSPSTNSGSNGNTPAPPNAAPTPASASAPQSQDDNLVCKWADCGSRFEGAETLYDHICEKHVGRKSTNNLNLACQWFSCTTTTVKRDHITSHIRVHVPLKPHKCEACGKSFKRPQDLKKHVKTHADESVLSQPSRLSQDHTGGLGGAYRPLPGKASSYYDQNGHMRTSASSFAAPHQNGHASYYTPHNTYGGGQQMFYSPALNTRSDYIGHQAATGAFDSRKRAFDDFNDFFQSAKRREINPNSYTQVSRSLSGLHDSITLGMEGMGSGFATAGAAVAVAGGGGRRPGALPTHQHYTLPLPAPMQALRSKEELQYMDGFLEAAQSNIYENSGSPTTITEVTDISQFSGTLRASTQPLAHRPLMSDHYSVAAVAHQAHQAQAQAAAAAAASPLTASSPGTTDSPARTPPSYTSGLSPRLSPSSRHGSLTGGVSYPQLSASIAAPSYPGSTAPQTLGSNFSAVERHLPGGNLGKPSRGPAREAARARDEGNDDEAAAPRSPSATSDDSEEPESYDRWLQNVRLIEAMREYVQNRLKNGDYEDEDGAAAAEKGAAAPRDDEDETMDVDGERGAPAQRPLYPTLRMDL